MEHLFLPFGFAFAGIGLLSAAASVAYPVMVIWMIIDGVLRSDEEYPGTEPNRKVLWVLGMVLVHPVALFYLFMVFAKVRRTPRRARADYTAAAPVGGAPAA
jgi:hypothetical protein